MKLVVKQGLLWSHPGDKKEDIIDVSKADHIARCNGYLHAESLVKALDGKTIHLDPESNRVTEIEEDFA